MEKIDLVKTDKNYYSAKQTPEIREYSEYQFLSIEGKGEPAGETFIASVKALYPLAYGVKKISKKKGIDFGVPKLEGLWWVNSDKHALEVPRNEWHWKLMIRMPSFVNIEFVQEAKVEVIEKKKLELVKNIHLINLTEGTCVQALHVGPYSTEHHTIQKMEDLVLEKGLKIQGLHHEIYLSDPTKTSPEKLKTILRYPVVKN
ncbi:MAG: GyrI-like domain-containing protein [Balneolaceae bacterium]